jgi:hypothetical protein
LVGREHFEALFVAAPVQLSDSRGHVVLCVPELRSVREVEDSLFRCRHKRRPQGRVDSLRIESIGAPLDKLDHGRTVLEPDRPVLAGHCDYRGR